MSETLLSIIVVSYNTRDLTLAAVESAWRDAQASSLLRQATEIIVVDNASTDDSVVALRQAYRSQPRIQIISQSHNGGFAQANNVGIEVARGQYVLLLNSDTVVQLGALETLVKTMLDFPPNDQTSALVSARGKIDRIGILTAQLLNPDGSLQAQGGSFPSLITLIGHWWMLDDLPLLGKFFPSTQHTGRRSQDLTATGGLVAQDWVAGTAMLLARPMIERIGKLDESIFMYGEDIEYCMRASHHHWDVVIQPQAQILHYGSASAGSARALEGEAKGYLYIWNKHYPLWQIPWVRTIIRIGSLLRALLFGTMSQYRPRARVYWHLWRTL